jgi:molybdenum cofactor cytidylyltransferase
MATHQEKEPLIAGIILASGLSSRFDGRNKLLAQLGGLPIIRLVTSAYLEGGLRPVHVVLGHEADQVEVAISGLDVVLIDNPHFAEGQSRSLVRGVASLPMEVTAAVIGVGDQPLLTAAVVSQLVETHRRSGAVLVAPRYAGRRGNPVLFDRSLFSELMTVEGDVGGRPVLLGHSDSIEWVNVDDALVGADVDRPDDYESLINGPLGRSRAPYQDLNE